MLTSKLKYTALLVLIASPSFVDASSSSSITRPKTKSQPSCSTAFKSKDVTFCASKENILAEPAALTSTPSHVTVRGGDAEEGGLLVRLKIGFYFALWYVLNIVYNSKCTNLICK